MADKPISSSRFNPEMLSYKLEYFTHGFARWAGSAKGFVVAFITVVAGLAAGALCHFSTGWENAFAIYMGTITFLMIFLIQRAQNKGLAALHLKLNELIATDRRANNGFMRAEDLTEKELSQVQQSHRQEHENT